jgi:hypothetical protein
MFAASIMVGFEFAIRNTFLGKINLSKMNHDLIQYMEKGSKVLAPVPFMFNEIDNFDIYGLLPARHIIRHRGNKFNSEYLCYYAKEIGAKYVLINNEYRRQFNCDLNDSTCFTCDGYEIIGSDYDYWIYGLEKE